MSVVAPVLFFIALLITFAVFLWIYPYLVRATSRYWYQGKLEVYEQHKRETMSEPKEII